MVKNRINYGGMVSTHNRQQRHGAPQLSAVPGLRPNWVSEFRDNSTKSKTLRSATFLRNVTLLGFCRVSLHAVVAPLHSR